MIDPKLLADIATENAMRYRAGLLKTLLVTIVAGDVDLIADAVAEICASSIEVSAAAAALIGVMKSKGYEGARVAYICLMVETGKTTWDQVEAAIERVKS